MQKNDPYAVLKIKDFRLFLSARFLLTFAIQMQGVVIGWQVYDITHDTLALGLVGLAEAIPFIISAIFSGHIADSYRRKRVIQISVSIYFASVLLLLLLTYRFAEVYTSLGILPIYLIIAITGISRSLTYPAFIAYLAQLVPRELYANSSTWNSTLWHIATVAGPAAGGLVYGFFSAGTAYVVILTCLGISLALFSSVKNQPKPKRQEGETLSQSLKAGLKFVFSNQLIVGAMSLDMFAVLFGGAVAVLPAFASDILHVGPEGLGFLRSAPATGAVIMSLVLAYFPPTQNSGKKLFIAVGGFGLCIIGFALSTNFYLSYFFLFASGAFDIISVIIRQTILQLCTQDEMRGRVAAVNSIFIGSSNEIGAFESGLAASLMGLVPSVVFGGCMTLVVLAIAAKAAPRLLKLQLKDI